MGIQELTGFWKGHDKKTKNNFPIATTMRDTIFSVLVLAVVMAAAAPGGIQRGEQLGVVGKPDKRVAMMASSGMMSMRLGGWSEENPADDEIQALVDRVKPDVGNHFGKNLNVFEAKTYRYQPVSGSMYIIKVHVGNDEYIHVKIWEKKWQNFYKPLGVQEGEKLEDPIMLEDNFEALEDNRKDGCNPNPCRNGGKCYSAADKTINCECTDDYKGEFCEKNNANKPRAYKLTQEGNAINQQANREIEPSPSKEQNVVEPRGVCYALKVSCANGHENDCCGGLYCKEDIKQCVNW